MLGEFKGLEADELEHAALGCGSYDHAWYFFPVFLALHYIYVTSDSWD